jgi:hypothetical protein
VLDQTCRTFHGQRAEKLLWNGEAGQQALIVAPACQFGQAPTQLRLGCARRPQQKQVLSCQSCQQQESNLGPIAQQPDFTFGAFLSGLLSYIPYQIPPMH